VSSRPPPGERVGVPVIRKRLGRGGLMGSVIKKRRKRMAKKKHRKLLKKTRIQRRNKK
jgi:Mitochondrial mRNA-processing protein COX24, C-terminal